MSQFSASIDLDLEIGETSLREGINLLRKKLMTWTFETNQLNFLSYLPVAHNTGTSNIHTHKHISLNNKTAIHEIIP